MSPDIPGGCVVVLLRRTHRTAGRRPEPLPRLAPEALHRALSELARTRHGSSHLNYFVYHDRYQRTPDGWKFTERVAELRYIDTAPLAGSAPQ